MRRSLAPSQVAARRLTAPLIHEVSKVQGSTRSAPKESSSKEATSAQTATREKVASTVQEAEPVPVASTVKYESKRGCILRSVRKEHVAPLCRTPRRERARDGGTKIANNAALSSCDADAIEASGAATVRAPTTNVCAAAAIAAAKAVVSIAGASVAVETAAEKENAPSSEAPTLSHAQEAQPQGGGREDVTWYCDACESRHRASALAALEPFRRVHGFRVHAVPKDGDCFYNAVRTALGAAGNGFGPRSPTVAEMRNWVAEAAGEEQLRFYQAHAQAHANECWLDFVRGGGGSEAAGDDSDSSSGGGSSSIGGSSSGGGSSSVGGSSSEGGAGGASSASGSRREATSSNGGHITSADAGGNTNADGDGSGYGKRGAGDSGRSGGRNGRPVRNCCAAVAFDGACKNPADLGSTADAPTSPHAKRRRSAAADAPAAAMAALGAAAPAAAASAKAVAGVEAPEEVAPCPATANPQRPRHWRRSCVVGDGDDSSGSGAGSGGTASRALVSTVPELREFIRREGAVYGHNECLWADEFAFGVVATRLRLRLLFIDMERKRGEWPYRTLAGSGGGGDGGGAPENSGRNGGAAADSAGAAAKSVAAAGGAGRGAASAAPAGERCVVLKREGPVGHFVFVATAGGKAVFSTYDMPDVVRQLWRLA
ncbi:unnamed protein product [Phaeothamnion confervicola]